MSKNSTMLAAVLALTFWSLPSLSQVILNHRPIASAGGYQLLGVPAGSTNLTTNLNASGSTDADGEPLSFSWADSSGQTKTLPGRMWPCSATDCGNAAMAGGRSL